MRRPAASSAVSHAVALSSRPIASSMSSTGPGAPPWSGPLSEPSAATIAETASERVEATTRAVNVDAFMPCSATVTR